MYSTVVLSAKYLKYLATSSNGKGHGIHSPFVYDFVRNVLNDRNHYPEYATIEQLRDRLLLDNTPVPVEDYGAGAGRAATSKSIAAITNDSSKNKRYAQLLFRIARHYQPNYIVELGTAAGISTAYLAAACPLAVVISGEGNYALASVARNNLRSVSLNHVKLVTGNFNNTVPEIIGSIPRVDLAFVDGNHRRKPTVDYFLQMIQRVNETATLIFDDIHWSQEMELAWSEIKSHPSVMLTVDLFFMGIVFLRPEFKTRQHFIIRF
jgi:predicted O-methyltransferase YrrM